MMAESDHERPKRALLLQQHLWGMGCADAKGPLPWRVVEPQGWERGAMASSQPGRAGWEHRRTGKMMDGVAYSGTFCVLSHQLRSAPESGFLCRRVSDI